MSTLVKQYGWYYAQFYNKDRNPKRKRVPLKAKTKKTAEQIKRKLGDQYALGDYNPWTEYNSAQASLPISENSTIKYHT